MPSRQWLSQARDAEPVRTPPLRHTVKCDGFESRRVKTPRQGRCSGHLCPVTVRTNKPGNLARRRNPFVIQSVIGPSSCFGRFRNNCPRASVAARPGRNLDKRRASYPQAKEDRLPPSVGNDPGPEYTCRVEDRGCGNKVLLGRRPSPTTSCTSELQNTSRHSDPRDASKGQSSSPLTPQLLYG